MATVWVLAAVPALAVAAGCSRSVQGTATAAAVATPAAPDELGRLIVSDVPSGLPRLADAHLSPPAGAKTLEDVAGYADEPARERRILTDYGYRYGWERFWGSDSGPTTGVFVDQFEHRAGAGAYAEDLARNDAELYEGVLHEDPPQLPATCRLLSVPEPDPDDGLPGPTALAWCRHGIFSVSVTAVAGSVRAAEQEVVGVLEAQLALLPPA